MVVKTLLNKLKMKNHQTIRVLDENVDYFIESDNIQEIVKECGGSKVAYFKYSDRGNCFLIYITKKK